MIFTHYSRNLGRKLLYNSNMKLVNIIENTIGHDGCTPLHGLSFYIETLDHKILMDAGPSDQILANASVLGVDLSQVDVCVLSHGHYDHSGGLLPFSRMNDSAKIYMQIKAADDYYAYDGPEEGYRYIGIDKLIPHLPSVYPLNGSFNLDDEISLLTVSEREYPVPSTNKRLMRKTGEDYVADDFSHEQSLVITEGEKNVLMCGCAHNGILNILEAFEERYGKMPDVVIGGFHLMRRSGETEEDLETARDIARKLSSLDTVFYTCHCTGEACYGVMKEIMGDKLSYIHCGESLTI